MTLTQGSLFYCLLSVCIIKCSKVTLVNNGYRNIVFAINPSLQYNPKLIENIQEMMTEASSYLHKATKYQLYFSDIKILLPAAWPLNSSLLQRPTTQSYEKLPNPSCSVAPERYRIQMWFRSKILCSNPQPAKANVIIAEPYLKRGDAPYTLQYGGCGEKGWYIHFTPNFMLNDEMTSVYGPKGRVFVHEWARFRWGVFNEHNNLIPFYNSNSGTSEATRCSLSIKGTVAECKGSSCSTCTFDQSTGLPNKECRFYPEKNQPSSSSIMYLQGLPNVDKFCDAETHNAEAPNMQNEMCNYESIWNVMNKSEDFRNISSPHTGSVKPNFTLLQAKYRVVSLVLDVSGSMGWANRIVRLRQAAEIFLLQIAEAGSQVGIVIFNSVASIKTQLKRIDNYAIREDLVQLLPTSAGGGTSICAGVRAGFQVLRGDDNSTNGDEIILLTDGIDNQISTCFPEVEASGAVIHTIALGPSAAVQLEELSTMTGGLQFAATDNLDTSGLIDSFSGLTSGNGDSSQQAIQLENLGRSIGNDTWLNGTVVIDETIGNDTFFVITWETQTPYILLHDPSGKSHNNSDFKIDEIVNTARLKIYGTAQTGTWIYSILNPGGNQVITITVTSRAADSAVPPITVKGYINRKDSTSPIIINVEVSHGFLPLLYANVTAIIERPSGPPIEAVLSDDGLGADIVRNDGIYSKYFFSFNGTGRYSVKVRVQGTAGTTRITIKKEGLLMPIPGYTENGNIEVIPQQPQANETHLNTTGDFNRVQAGGTISLPSDPPPVDFPPCKITDLQATIVKNEIKLEWTAPGGDYDQGSASRYELRMSDNLLHLRDNFPKALLINLTGMHPQLYGSKETVFFPVKPSLQNGETVYFAVRAYDKSNYASELSNIARVTFFVLLVEPLVDLNDNYVSPKAWIAAVVIGIVGLVAGIIVFIMHAKRPKKISVAA